MAELVSIPERQILAQQLGQQQPLALLLLSILLFLPQQQLRPALALQPIMPEGEVDKIDSIKDKKEVMDFSQN